MRLSSGLILCACVACLCLAACKEDEETAAPPVVRSARVAVVTPHNLELAVQGAGRIEARYVSQVGFDVGGRLISRSVDIGSVVTKGETLAALSANDFENKVISAEADLSTATATLTRVAGQEERDRILADKGYTPRAVYDESLKSLRSAEAAMQAAQAQLRIAQNQLDYTQLLAPNDGVVTATGADPGQVVEAGQMVVEISRDAEREAVFAVAGADVARAAIEMPVKVWLQAHLPGCRRQRDPHLVGSWPTARTSSPRRRSSDDALQPFRMGRQQPGHHHLLCAPLPHRRTDRLPAAGP